MSDEELAREVRAGRTELYELLMRRNNPRVYRAVRSVIRDEAEVEDVMQQAYVSAFQHLDQFQEKARFSTWLVRIALHEAFARLRRSRRFVALDNTDEDPMSDPPSTDRSPEDETAGRELIAVLERAVDTLPDIYRTAFMLREIDELSTADTAAALEVSEEVVKTRLHRARTMLRAKLSEQQDAKLTSAFQFHAPRCDRVVGSVMQRIVHGTFSRRDLIE